MKYLPLLILCLIISGCRKYDAFTVNGIVAGAAGQTLYLEHTGLPDVTILDSVKLKTDCNFSFKQPRPEHPDFYRLNLNNQRIHFSVDSTETVSFNADLHSFSSSYTVEGSENSKLIKEIWLALLDAEKEVQKLRDTYGMNLIPENIYQENMLKIKTTYKDIVKKHIFSATPLPSVAYFALFQKIDGLWIFDLYDRDDSKVFAAVANSYKFYYPESVRTKHLETLALQSLKIIRGERQKKIDFAETEEVGFIDIELPNINGENVKLSDNTKGKTVLVTFTTFQSEWSTTFIYDLTTLYNKYKDKGFEIYMISLDIDVHVWKNAIYQSPWINVRDPQSIYSSIAAIYNVSQLPALFLINKKGELVKRIETNQTMEGDIKAAL